MVTGHDASGRSVFVSDEKATPLPLKGFHRLWAVTAPRSKRRISSFMLRHKVPVSVNDQPTTFDLAAWTLATAKRPE